VEPTQILACPSQAWKDTGPCVQPSAHQGWGTHSHGKPRCPWSAHPTKTLATPGSFLKLFNLTDSAVRHPLPQRPPAPLPSILLLYPPPVGEAGDTEKVEPRPGRVGLRLKQQALGEGRSRCSQLGQGHLQICRVIQGT